MKKIIGLLLVLMLVSPMAALAEPTDAEYEKWATEHGYVKMDTVDATSSATAKKAGGVNYGAIEWDDELRIAAIKEILKGGVYLGDPAFAQDETGNNYREMYQLATCANNIPSNTNLELVMDASTLHLLGSSEANTGKTIEFQANPNVSVSWCRQLRVEEEETYNYYCSYGVQFNGKVTIYTADDLATPEGEAAIINLFDKYYPTLASTWVAYGAGLADKTTPEEIKAAKLAYITKSMSSGSMVLYEIVPTSIVITAPFLMNMSPSMANAGRFTAVQEGEDKYAYDLGLSDALLDKLVAFKAAYIATDAGKAEVEAYYTAGMYPTLDGYCATYGCPTSLDYALMETNAAGLKTQTTYVPAE